MAGKIAHVVSVRTRPEVHRAGYEIEDGGAYSQIFDAKHPRCLRARATVNQSVIETEDGHARAPEFIVADSQRGNNAYSDGARTAEAVHDERCRLDLNLRTRHEVCVESSEVTAGVNEERTGICIYRAASANVKVYD